MNRKTQTLTVAFKNPDSSLFVEEVEEESDYVNRAVCTVDTTPVTSDKKSPSFTQSYLPIAVSWVILLVIMALRIHFTSVISENNAKLTAVHKNLMIQTKQLKTQNQELKTQNQVLETQKNNLTEQLQNAETKWNEKSVAVAQQAIDAYCPLKNNRKCEPCEGGWVVNQPKCFAINNPEEIPKQKTWEEARENCREKISDLTVIADAEEKRFISDHSWNSQRLKGYWMGLRVEDGRWKWINGSYLTESSWTERPTNGHCAISVHNEGWKSVKCTEKNRWFCEKKALSLLTLGSHN